MDQKNTADHYVLALPPDKSLKKMIGEHVNLGDLFTPEKIKACQKLIDMARDEFFEEEKPKVEQMRHILKANNQKALSDIEKMIQDIKGQARIFGFSFIVLVCNHILDFADDQTKSIERRILIIARFVDVLFIAMSHKIKDDGGALEKELKIILG